MFNEKEFKNRTIELITKAKHQREGIGLALTKEFNLPGAHTASRKVKNIFKLTLAELIKLRFQYPDDWIDKLPESELLESKDIYTRVMELRGCNASFTEVKKSICQEFGLKEMELLRISRSLFQKTLAEVFEPTQEEALNALIRADTSEEFKKLLGVAPNKQAGIFQKYFNKSNFVSAKANINTTIKVPSIIPNTSDNEAIVISQVLGDGSYDKVRGALRIQHGIKQLDYLKLKVSLLKNAYPQLNGLEDIKIRLHAQGHEYCDWYSKRLPDHITSVLDKDPKEDLLISKLTPLGWYLWFMDDGNLHSGVTPSLSICGGIDLSLHNYIKEAMLKYNINGNSYDKAFSIQQRIEITKFLNTFIKPFSHITPQCMMYKTQFMI